MLSRIFRPLDRYVFGEFWKIFLGMSFGLPVLVVIIDLVDNPQYDHTYTVFAQVLNGLDTIDRILEGDVIERVEILP